MPIFCSSQEFDDLCRQLSGRAEFVRLQAKGGSMHPFIQSGDWVTIALRKDGKDDTKIGDIVLLRSQGNLHMHRVIRKDKDGLLVKGDASFGADGVAAPEDIIARVVSVERRGRSIDLNLPANRFMAASFAGASLLLQYPILFIRKISALGGSVFSGVQGRDIYRRSFKKISSEAIVIREATEEDIEGMRDLLIMGGHDIKKGIIDVKKEGFWLVAERKKKIVGALTITRFKKDPRLWVIFGLEVKPILRGLGIGERIVREAIATARGSGAEEIGLFVNKRSAPALALYRKLGFNPTDKFPSEFHRSDDELYLSYKFLPGNITENRIFRKDWLLINMIKSGFEELRVDEFIKSDPDWAFLLNRSVKEGVFYPFYRNILAIDEEARLIPEEFRDKFHQTYYLHLAKSAEFAEDLERTLKDIDSLNIKVLLFKGVAIDALIYDGYLRQRLDLDIVAGQGDEPRLESYLAVHKDDMPVRIHVHRHLVNNTFLSRDRFLDVDMEKIWAETENFKDFRNMVTLKPELNILYLCEHALKHDFDQLVFLYEIERLINFYGKRIDWSKFLKLVHEFNMERIVYYGLYLVKEILAGRVPPGVVEALKPKRFSIGEKRFLKDTLNRTSRRYGSYPVYLASRDGFLKKAKFLFRTIFPKGYTVKDNFDRIRRSVLS